MQQFVVPQFIDVEDKVLGPLSVRQFVILLIGAGVIFLLFRIMSFFAWVFAVVLICLMLFLFAFVKINGRPFHYFLLSLIQTFRLPQLKVWTKDPERYEIRARTPIEKAIQHYVPKEKQAISSSRLTQLSLAVDTGGAYNPEDTEEPSRDKDVTLLEI